MTKIKMTKEQKLRVIGMLAKVHKEIEDNEIVQEFDNVLGYALGPFVNELLADERSAMEKDILDLRFKCSAVIKNLEKILKELK